MSEDHNLPEEENTNSPEENLNPEEQVSPKTSDLSEEVNTEDNDVVEESNEDDSSDDVFGDDGEEDVFGGNEADETSEEPGNEEPAEVTAPVEQPAVEVEPTAVKKKVEDSRRWYSLRVISGKERKIKERIELEISRSKWGDFVTQILVPSEKVYKIRNGKIFLSKITFLPFLIL